MSGFNIGARVRHHDGRLATLRSLREEGSVFTMVRFDQPDEDGGTFAFVAAEDLILVEDQSSPEPPQRRRSRNLAAFQEACDGLSIDERNDFAHCFIGSLGADCTGIDPKVWDGAIDIAVSLVEERSERKAATRTVTTSVDNRPVVSNEVVSVPVVHADVRVPGDQELAEPAVGVGDLEVVDSVFGFGLPNGGAERGVGPARDRVVPAVEPDMPHDSSPSVGAPAGAVCDNPNPTDGDCQGGANPKRAVVVPPGAAAPPPAAAVPVPSFRKVRDVPQA